MGVNTDYTNQLSLPEAVVAEADALLDDYDAAKNAEALRILNDKIRDREIEKYYLCAVQGRPRKPSGRLENYLFKDAAKNQVYVKNRPEPGAKTA